jgi:hypothetical protein
VLALGAAATVLGCGITRRPIAGRDLPAAEIARLVPEETTRDEVLQAFGEPESLLEYPDGSQELRYSYTGLVDHHVNVVVYSRTRTEKEFKQLFVRVREGIVTEVTYTNTADPGENVFR